MIEIVNSNSENEINLKQKIQSKVDHIGSIIKQNDQALGISFKMTLPV